MTRNFVLCGIVAIALSSCATQEVAYKNIDNFTVSNVFDTPQVTMDMHLHNPNPIGGTLRNMELTVMLNNKPLGSVQIDDKVRIKRQSDFTVPVTFTTSIGQMGGILSSGISAYFGNDSMPVGLTGSITVQKFLIFRKTFAFDYSDGIKPKEILQK